jgi:ABC-type multidrug transport system ATPase subunit
MIRFRQVMKRFGRQLAVADFTVDIRAGEVTALLGPNGSGKTTTRSHICRSVSHFQKL